MESEESLIDREEIMVEELGETSAFVYQNPFRC